MSKISLSRHKKAFGVEKMIEYLIFFLFRAQKAAKMLFQTFCPWTIQFSTDETPFVHGRRDFYLFIELFATENSRKSFLWVNYWREMPVLTHKNRINFVGRQ